VGIACILLSIWIIILNHQIGNPLGKVTKSAKEEEEELLNENDSVI